MRTKFYITLTTVFAVLFFACVASADDIYDQGTDAEASFANAIQSDAVINTPSIQEIAKHFKKLKDKNIDVDVRLIDGLSTLKEIMFYARRKLDPVNNTLEADLLVSIESVWGQLSGSRSPNALSRPTNWNIDPNDFTVNLVPSERVLDFKATYLDKVPSSPDAYRNAIDTLGILVLTHRTLNYVKRKAALEKVGSVARERKAQWQVYFDESIPQWPWELALVNGPIYESTLKDETGLGKVPEWQLIVAHPDVALEYVEGAADGDQFRPALLIEIVGADFWTWEDGAKQKGPWGFPIPLGAGLVATFADRADSDDWGFGGVIHFNHIYNVGATFRGSDTGIFVSLNLAKLFENKSKKAEKYLDMVGL